MKYHIKVALMPVVIIAIGFLISFTFSHYIGPWAFIPLAIIYWTSIGAVIKINKTKLLDAFIKTEFCSKVNLLAYIPCLLCVIAFVWGLHCISLDPFLILLSLIFAVVNPVMEEMFWRQYLLDRLKWKSWVKIAYSTALFALSHPLMWGVFSITIRSKIMVFLLVVMGVLWGVVYIKTKSLRHCVIAHSIVDVLNLSVWVFLNLYIPPAV